MNTTMRAVLFWLVIVVSAFLLWQFVRSDANEPRTPEISYSQFVSQIANGQISKVTIAGSVVHGYDTKGAGFTVVAPPNQQMMLELLQEHGVEIWFKQTSEQGSRGWIMNLLPMVLLATLWFFMIRTIQRGIRLQAGAKEPQSRVGS